jgi:hypothetical protein
MLHPYEDLPPDRFWRTGVAQDWRLTLDDLYRKRFSIDASDVIVTAGSCFAQHITRVLREHSFGVLDLEPAPVELPFDQHERYGYSLYSARYGNIYTAKQLSQLAAEAFGVRPMRVLPWRRGDQLVDALRPTIEPDGFGSMAELAAHRRHHLGCVRECLERMDVFVFTLGLTEAWCDRASRSVLPLAPGVVAGDYRPEAVRFVNFGIRQTLRALERFLRLLQEHRPARDCPRVLLTVSPVPLTATATDRHVLAATTESKAVLRVAAAELRRRHPTVDYFPSYEIIQHPAVRSQFFNANLRSVSELGVRTVMDCFLRHHPAPDVPASRAAREVASSEQTLICEEELLDRQADG